MTFNDNQCVHIDLMIMSGSLQGDKSEFARIKFFYRMQTF